MKIIRSIPTLLTVAGLIAAPTAEIASGFNISKSPPIWTFETPPPAGRTRFCPIKTQPLQIELVDEYIDHPNRIVLCNVIVKALREQRTLGSVFTFDKTLHVARPDTETSAL